MNCFNGWARVHGMRLRLLLACLLQCGIWAASATERFVVPPAPGLTSTPPYTDWNHAATNIQDAVNVSSNNDVIWVTNGTYYCWSNSAYSGYTSMVTVVRASNITIQSMNGPAVTIVNANYPYFTNRCFYIMSNATLSGLTITNGHAKDLATYAGGGGVFIWQKGRVTNCWITGNTTTNGVPTDNSNGGGGVYAYSGCELLNCRIYGNSSTNGYLGSGGMLAYFYGNSTIRDCIFSNNTYGGAGISLLTSLYISNCTFVANNNPVGNGLTLSLDANNTAYTVDNCRMIGNVGYGLNLASATNGLVKNCQMINNAGGGVFLSGGGVISNCLISSNISAYGGGIYCSHGTANMVQNCTIVSNYGTA